MKNKISNKGLVNLFEDQVAENSEKIALVYQNEKLTYKELNNRANFIANKIINHYQGQKNNFVPIILPRSIEVVIAIIGVLKSGNAYVFIEPETPIERVKFIMKEISASLLITNDSIKGRNNYNIANIISENSESLTYNKTAETKVNDPVYVVYTSGSTGKPKGVVVEHKNIMNYYHGIVKKIPFENCNSYAHLTTFSADLGNTILYVSLLNGSCLHILSKETVFNSIAFEKYIQENEIDCYKSVPSHLNLLIENSTSNFFPKKVLISGGEKLDGNLANKLLERIDKSCSIFNHYGPTETCIGVLTYKLDVNESYEDSVPIGKPIENVRCYVLDQNYNYVPLNFQGELYVSGDSLARGYLCDSKLTKDKFLKDKISREDIIYKTGDIVKILPSGNLEYVSRADDQIKINGYRVELKEIEEKIKSYSKVDDAIVKYYNTDNKKILVAFVKPAKDYLFVPNQENVYRASNGLIFNFLNKNEAKYLYKEIFELQAYNKYNLQLKDGDVVFDVGTNIGLFSLYISSFKKKIKIYTFEPNPDIYELMKMNLDRYKIDYVPHNLGLSDVEEIKEFTFYSNFSILSGYYANENNEKELIKKYVDNHEENDTYSKEIINDNIANILEKRFEDKKVIKTQLLTLSSIIKDNELKNIDLLKINVEKSELNVLKGLEKHDWNKIKKLIIEIDTEDNYHEVIKLLKENSFEVRIEKDPLLKNTNLYYVFGFSRKDGIAPEENTIIKQRSWENIIDDQELQKYLSNFLPHYMVPSKHLFINSLPINSNGKIDANKLKVIYNSRQSVFVPPKTPTEILISSILQEILNVERISIIESFFVYGMDSMKAILLKMKLNENAINIDINDVFQHNSIKTLADKIKVLKTVKVSDNSDIEIGSHFKSYIKEIESGLSNIDKFPATYGQRAGWKMYQDNPKSYYRNITEVYYIKDSNAQTNIRQVFDALIEKYDFFKTQFSFDDGLFINVLGHVEYDIIYHDLSQFTRNIQEEKGLEIKKQQHQKAFAIDTDMLFRISLLKIDIEQHVVLFTTNHINYDGWSSGILKRDFYSFYETTINLEKPEIKKLKYDFKHFALWKDHFFNTPALNHDQTEFWKNYFKNFTDYPHLPYQPDSLSKEEGSGYTLFLENSYVNNLKEIAKNEKSSLYMILVSSAIILLYLETSKKDLTVGFPHVNRGIKEFEDIIGEFVGPVPFRVTLNVESRFKDLLKAVSSEIFDIISRPKFPSFYLKEMFNLDTYHRFSMFVQQVSQDNIDQDNINTGTKHFPEIQNARFEYGIYPNEYKNGLELLIKYKKEYYSAEAIEKYSQKYCYLLKKISEEKDFKLTKIIELFDYHYN